MRAFSQKEIWSNRGRRLPVVLDAGSTAHQKTGGLIVEMRSQSVLHYLLHREPSPPLSVLPSHDAHSYLLSPHQSRLMCGGGLIHGK
jgi:hypothetical protein